MRVVFAGTPEFAATILRALLDSPHSVVSAYTQPDRPAGRGRQLRQSPVKVLAASRGIAVHQPNSLKAAEASEQLAAMHAEVMVVAAYGLLLPQSILETPNHGCINVHASLLPRWRGAAPIQRAILAGDDETGVSIMQMDAGLDTGGVFRRDRCEISPQDTAASLHTRLADLGAQALLEVLTGLQQGNLNAAAQSEEGACYAARVDKREARLDWSLDADTLDRTVRAFNPWPVAFTWLPGPGNPDGRRLRVWSARPLPQQQRSERPGTVLQCNTDGIDVATGSGVLTLLEIQRPGSRAMPAGAFLNAHPLSPGIRLGED